MRGDQIKDALTLGRWRRKRTMMRLLRELDRIDARELHPARRRNTEWPRRLGIGLVALALTATILGISTHRQFGVRFDRSGITVASPLGKPPPVPETGGSFAFAATQPDGSAVAYDPCKPIEYVVNDALAPPGSEGLLHSAISEISAATGLVFEYVGASTDVPTQADGVGASDRDPALLAWTTPAEVSDLAGRVAGVGGSATAPDRYSGRSQYVTGIVALDAPQLARVLRRENGDAQVRAIIVHELAHLVGLAHVDDPHELMYGDNVGTTELGTGDRRGLAALGSGRCFH